MSINYRTAFTSGALATLLLHGPICAADSNSARIFALDDVYTEVRLSSPHLSPNGRQLIAAVSRPVVAENRYDDSIVLVDVNTGAQRELAGPEANVAVNPPNGDLAEEGTRTSSATWSPSGDRVAWLSSVDKNSQINIWSAAQPDAKARVVSINLPDPITLTWSPDGRWFAITARDPGPSLSGAARFDKSFEVLDYSQSAFSYTPPARQTQLWLVAADGSALRALSQLDEDVRDIAWQNDSHAIVYHSEPNSTQIASRRASLKAVDIQTGNITVLVPEPAHILDNLRVSDRGTIAYRSFEGADPWTHAAQITALVNGQPVKITSQLDRNVSQFEWLPGGKALLVGTPDHDRGALWSVSLDGHAARLNLAPVNAYQFTLGAAGTLAFIGDEATRAPEIYFTKSVHANPRPLTRLNDSLAALKQGRMESITWHSGGYEHTGTLTYPPDFTPGRRYPLLVGIHGGPEASVLDAFNAQSQYLATQGWLVFQPNYRGSDNMGERYQAAVIEDPIDGPGSDILAGIQAVAAGGRVDEHRIALTGYSYGGVMTYALTTRRDFCAAVPRDGVTNFTDYYNFSDSSFWLDEMLGSPWKAQNEAKYAAGSPISQISKVHTPTLMLHNAGDFNAPVTDAYTWFQGLRSNGVKARLIVFGAPGHGADLARRRADVHYILEWTAAQCGDPRRPGG